MRIAPRDIDLDANERSMARKALRELIRSYDGRIARLKRSKSIFGDRTRVSLNAAEDNKARAEELLAKLAE
jgi:hypothetical protein